jgi:RNA polymerase sigma factor FliA
MAMGEAMPERTMRNRAGWHGAGDLACAWQALRADDCQAARSRIVDAYLPFARMLAARLYGRRTYRELDFYDYFQFASIGLLEAIDRFDAALGIKFETFSAHRINGAILSGVAGLSEIQVQVAARRRILAARTASLKDALPDSGDAAAVFGHLAELAIGLAVGFALEDSGMYLEQAPVYGDNSYQRAELAQLQKLLRDLTEELPANERRVITYHYVQQLAFDEIATILGLTKGRVSQIHKAALGRLKQTLAASHVEMCY